MLGISVIMPSYLGKYPGSRKDPENKFIRAVESFLLNKINEKELIIVSDGCDITNRIYKDRFEQYDFIKLVQVEKRKATWPGELRECGRSLAKYDWITYLDTDDIYQSMHLYSVVKAILDKSSGTTLLLDTKYTFPIAKDPNEIMLAYLGMDINAYNEFRSKLKPNSLYGECLAASKSRGHNGTWQITHHKEVPHRWQNTTEMGEDKSFIERMKSTEKWEEFTGCYLICHNTKDRKTIWEM